VSRDELNDNLGAVTLIYAHTHTHTHWVRGVSGSELGSGA